MKISKVVTPLSYTENGGFKPLFNPNREDSYGDPVAELLQSFIDAGGYDASIAAPTRVYAPELVNDNLSWLPILCDALTQSKQEWTFLSPELVEGEREPLALTARQIGEHLVATYLKKDRSPKTGLSLQGSGQRRWLGYVAYGALCDAHGLAFDDFDFAPLVHEGDAQSLSDAILRDNATTGRNRPSLRSLYLHYSDLRSRNPHWDAMRIATEVGDDRLLRKGKIVNGEKERMEGFHLLSLRCGLELTRLSERPIDKSPSSWTSESPIYLSNCHRSDLTWLTSRAKKLPSKILTEVYRYHGYIPVIEKQHAAPPVDVSFLYPEDRLESTQLAKIVESYFEIVHCGSLGGEQRDVKKSRQSTGDAGFADLLAWAGTNDVGSVLCPIGDVLGYLACDDRDGLKSLVADSRPKKVVEPVEPVRQPE